MKQRDETTAAEEPAANACRECGEPLSLREMPERLCLDCEESQNERRRLDVIAERGADAAFEHVYFGGER